MSSLLRPTPPTNPSSLWLTWRSLPSLTLYSRNWSLNIQQMSVLQVSFLHSRIHCLSKLYQQGRGLDELVLESILLDHTDIREFFTTIRHLSHQHGTTLVLTPIRYREESSIFVDLGKEFQETKIKKIVCNMSDRHTDPHSQLDPLAEEVVVHYPSCFYTTAGRKCYYPSCADINLLSGRIQYFGGSWQGIPTDKDQ